MKIEEIEVTIGTDGKVHLQTSGFSGEACLEATGELEALLGGLPEKREFTAEMTDRQSVRTAEKVKIRH